MRNPNRTPGWRGAAFIATCSVLLLAGCGGLSDVGKLPTTGPTATAGFIGQPYTVDSTGTSHTTVRGGAVVALTGADSVPGSSPVLGWSLSPSGSTPTNLLVQRASAAWSLTAPFVATPTDLTFALTVTDANGKTATANAVVSVLPVADADVFLSYLDAPRTYRLVVGATAPVAPAAGAGKLADLTVTITRWVSYATLGGAQKTLQVGTQTIQDTLQGTVGIGSTATDPRNPVYEVPLPRLNVDDVNNYAGLAVADRLDLSQVGGAQVTLCFNVTAATALPGTGNMPQLFVLDATGTQKKPGALVPIASPPACNGGQGIADAVATLAPTNSSTQEAGADTYASSAAYYATIDPQGSRATFGKWLQTNGWGSTSLASLATGASAHAIYANNFDLGLGRDMYTRLGACDTPGQILPGQCDVSSVVINYIGLEAAAKKSNPINAVAMEYRRPDAGACTPGQGVNCQQRIVTFLAYVPNPNDPTGDYVRVQSVNLDFRGEKFLPGACTVCHGGTPAPLVTANGATTYGTGYQGSSPGDVNAGFLPWDLQSFLFSDTDLSWTNPDDVALRQGYTRKAQEPQLQLLNAAAYVTYGDVALSPNRFKVARELVAGFYGSANVDHGPVPSLGNVLAAATFTDNFVPVGWRSGAADTLGFANTAANAAAGLTSSEQVYLNVYAQNCRTCHTLEVPAIAHNDPTSTVECAKAATAAAQRTALNNQYAVGCYWTLINATNLVSVLERSQMPLARRTADRYWLPLPAATASAGQFLNSHLAGLGATTVRTPGTVPLVDGNAFVSYYRINTDGTIGARQPCGLSVLPSCDPNPGLVTLAGAASYFALDATSAAGGPIWTVTNAGSAVPVSGARGVIAPFAVTAAGAFKYTLALTTAAGSTLQPAVTGTFPGP